MFGNTCARELVEVVQSPDLMKSGWWAVVQTFEGEFFGFRFKDVQTNVDDWFGQGDSDFSIPTDKWESSLSKSEYMAGVERIREHIASGWVYQANFCRVLTATTNQELNVRGLLRRIENQNPAPFACGVFIHREESGLQHDVRLVSASPELFIRRKGRFIQSSPIKGTAKHETELLDKDSSENVMIVDLIRNDLSHVCRPGTVAVPDLLRVEHHPGLTHLVSDVTGELRDNVTWTEIFDATMPPGSVSGAPKSSALRVIDELEPVAREIYCGTVGWIDLDNEQAELAVGIRTFWQALDGTKSIKFGTGAGITYASDPEGEWFETELKAEHLLRVAATSDH